MTLFESLNDLMAVISKLDKKHIGLVLGKQQETPNPDKLYTLVIYYTDYGILYHESNISYEPGNAALYDEHVLTFKKLGIKNSEISIEVEPAVKINSLPEDKTLLDKMLNVSFQ